MLLLFIWALLQEVKSSLLTRVIARLDMKLVAADNNIKPWQFDL